MAKFFDLTTLWRATLGLANFYLDWVKNDLSLIHNFRVLVRGNGLWRTVAFVDDDRWAEHARTFHLPIMANDEVQIPEEKGTGVIVDINESPTSLWSALLQIIGMMFGLPTETLMDLIRTFTDEAINEYDHTM